MSEPAGAGGIDVDRLMADLERRVEARRAAGELDPAVLDLPFDGDEPAGGGPTVRLRPETAYSTKPGVGRIITLAKRSVIRFLFHFLNDLVIQINGALARLDAAQAAAEREAVRSRDAVQEDMTRLEHEVADLGRRVAAVEGRSGPPPAG
ncbi:MAG: hypothetical protein RIB67_05560 [Miltoncostaeaceae bacterium]